MREMFWWGVGIGALAMAMFVIILTVLSDSGVF